MNSLIIIATGIVIFLFGQYILKFFIEPIMDLRKHIGKIAFILIFHANEIYSANENTDIVRKEIRESSSKLIEFLHIPICYKFLHKLFAMPSQKDVYDSAGLLLGLSNANDINTLNDSKKQRIKKIKELLKIKVF